MAIPTAPPMLSVLTELAIHTSPPFSDPHRKNETVRVLNSRLITGDREQYFHCNCRQNCPTGYHLNKDLVAVDLDVVILFQHPRRHTVAQGLTLSTCAAATADAFPELTRRE